MQAFERMLHFNKQHKDKDIKELYKAMQKHHIANNETFEQIFASSSAVCQLSPIIFNNIVAKIQENARFDASLTDFSWGAHLFGAWRNTVGVYRIDSDIFDDVIKSPVPHDTPTAIFKNLPEWAVYVEFPSVQTFAKHKKVLGFWACFDERQSNNVPKLTLNITPNVATKTDEAWTVKPLPLFIDNNLSVQEAVYEFHQTLLKHRDEDDVSSVLTSDYELLTHMLSCLLLLCVQEPDISSVIGEPVSRADIVSREQEINKKTGAFIVPNAPIIYELGARLGGEIRKKQAEVEQGFSDGTRTVRPHIRRGHWHGYWRGTGQAKEFKVRWQSAIFVNA